jgi:hypothetical protein
MTVLLLAVGFSPLVARQVGASPIDVYSTGFEAPTFAAGSQLLGQDAWSTAIPPFLNPEAALISAAHPAGGAQHVRVWGRDLVSAEEVAPFYDAVGSYRRPVNYDTAANNTPIVWVQGDVRLDSPPIHGLPAGHGYKGPDRFSANIAAITPDGTVGEISISSDGFVYGFGGVDPGAGPFFGLPISLGKYHHLAMKVDFAADNTTFYFDDQELGTAPFADGFTSDVLRRGSLVCYARGNAGMRNHIFYDWDNFSITAEASPTPAPEPGMIALTGLPALLLWRRPRR